MFKHLGAMNVPPQFVNCLKIWQWSVAKYRAAEYAEKLIYISTSLYFFGRREYAFAVNKPRLRWKDGRNARPPRALTHSKPALTMVSI